MIRSPINVCFLSHPMTRPCFCFISQPRPLLLRIWQSLLEKGSLALSSWAGSLPWKLMGRLLVGISALFPVLLRMACRGLPPARRSNLLCIRFLSQHLSWLLTLSDCLLLTAADLGILLMEPTNTHPSTFPLCCLLSSGFLSLSWFHDCNIPTKTKTPYTWVSCAVCENYKEGFHVPGRVCFLMASRALELSISWKKQENPSKGGNIQGKPATADAGRKSGLKCFLPNCIQCNTT